MARLRDRLLCLQTAVFLFLIPGIVLAEAPVLDLGEQRFSRLRGQIEILEDATASLSLEQARSASGYELSRTGAPSYGFTDSVFWARLRIRNPGNAPRTGYLEMGFPGLNDLQFFEFEGDALLRSVQTGANYPHRSRGIPSRNYAFLLELPPGAERDVYFRFESAETMMFPIRFFSREGFINYTTFQNFIQGLYFGILIVMILYNLILYFSYRDNSYLFYVLYISSFFLLQLAFAGYLYQYVWPEAVVWNRMGSKLYTGLTCFWGIVFTRSFLPIRRYSPLLDRILLFWLIPAAGLCVLPIFYPDRIGAIATNIVSMVMVLLLLVSGIYMVYRGYHPARYFLLAFGMLILGAVMLILTFSGLLPGIFITRNGLQIGSALEMILLSLGLRDKIITERLEKEAAERQHTENRLRMLDSFARFVPRQFLEHLRKSSLEDVLPGDAVREELTVLFTDLRGFTSLSEGMTVEDNFRFINSYVEAMQPEINRQGGFIDKFIGDAIMALFTTPDAALRAALGMRAALQRYNADRKSRGESPVEMGIGLNTGELMLGTVGTSERMDTTVIGDPVNLASRLESLTKHYGLAILLSEQVVERLGRPEDFELRKLDLVRVKGKQEAVRVYELQAAR